MKIARTAIALVLVALPLPLSGQQPAATLASVDRVFEQWTSTVTPGCAVGVARDGAPVVARAYGMADLEHGVPNGPGTIFEAGSVSKQFTAAAVILLAQQGRLSLDDDVRRYVPELPDYGTPITIRQLMTHTSGLRDWGSVAAISGLGRSVRTHTHDHVLDILGRQRGLNFSPGSEYSYSNSGYNLLAVIVDRVSGMSFAEFSKLHVFVPLGMTDTQWRDDYTRVVRGRASAYSFARGGYVIDRPIENVHGNGGLLTTVADLLTWNVALAAGRIGGSDFVERMHRRQLLTDGTQIEYAGGLFITDYDGVAEIGHTGATSGYRAFLARYPDHALDVAVLCNAGNANPGTVGRLVARAFLGDAVQPGTSPASTAAAPQTQAAATWSPSAVQLQAIAGEYHSPDAEMTLRLSVDDGVLVAHRRPATRIRLTPAGTDVFDSSLGRIRLIRSEAGDVVQLSLAQARVFDLRFDRVVP